MFLYGVPGYVGGAATKILDLINLLKNELPITIIVPDTKWLKDKSFLKLSSTLGVDVKRLSDVESFKGETLLAVCETSFFSSGHAQRLKELGARIVWSNDMMWTFKGEVEAVRSGLIDLVVFVSNIQRDKFSDIYFNTKSELIPNYISPSTFPFSYRTNKVFTIGRLSRADPLKYPVNFPCFYEDLKVSHIKFRVQAWSHELRRKYSWHHFDARWDLLESNAEPAREFLQSLDLFVYPLGHRVTESYGRSTVEAMLTGCVPIVPSGHNFGTMIPNGVAGYVYNTFEEVNDIVLMMHRDNNLRQKISKASSDYVREHLCNEHTHRNMWLNILQ